MLRLHEYNEKIFDGSCLAYLSKAVNVEVTENLQQPWTMKFEYPMNDEKADMIRENRIVSVEGQGYRIDSVSNEYGDERMLKASATHVFFADGTRHHIPTIGYDKSPSGSTIGVDPNVVINAAVRGIGLTNLSKEDVKALGMTRIGSEGERIDFFPTDKINTYDAICAVIQGYGRGEIYVDNYTFAVVERVGKDNGTRLTLTKNLSRLSIERHTAELVTRLYPYGADDLTITGSVPYIESERAKSMYGVIDGYKDYPDCDDQAKLYANAVYDLMGDDNDNRLDTPQITITGEVIELDKLCGYGDFETIRLGDTVTVREGGTEYKKRIISITRYPFSADKPTVTIGAPSNSDPFFVVWQRTCMLKNVKKNSSSYSGKLKSNYLSGHLSSTRSPVRSDNGLLRIDDDLLTIYDKDTGKKRLELGNAGGLFALNIYDNEGRKSNSNLKIKLGDAGDEYAFAMYDKTGEAAIYMTDSGEVYFSGTIETKRDAVLGTSLSLGYGADPVIRFKAPSGSVKGQVYLDGETLCLEADNINLIGNIFANGAKVSGLDGG